LRDEGWKVAAKILEGMGKHAEGRASALEGRARLLYTPRPANVRCGPGGVPIRIGTDRVEHVLESWLVEDRWWTDLPLERRYWEVTSAGGRNLVVFHDLRSGDWFDQRA
jgi:hypothetical protein